MIVHLYSATLYFSFRLVEYFLYVRRCPISTTAYCSGISQASHSQVPLSAASHWHLCSMYLHVLFVSQAITRSFPTTRPSLPVEFPSLPPLYVSPLFLGLFLNFSPSWKPLSVLEVLWATEWCYINFPSIHCTMGSMPVGVQCPLMSSLGEFLGYWAGSGILSFRPCWVPSPFPSPSISWSFFHSLFFTCHWISFMFLLYDWCICTHSVDPSLTHLLGQAWDWLWYLMLWSQRRNRGVHGAEISIQISALARVEPWILASSSRECYH